MRKEVIDSFSGIRSFEDVLRVQERKKEERGGFAGRILLIEVFEERGE